MIIWAAAYCEPRKEFQAQGEIQKHGFETFLPVLSRTKMIHKKRVLLTEPIFTRYCFAAMPLNAISEAYSKIKRCRGVLYLLEGPKGPSAVPNEVIEKFRHAERHGAFDFTKPKAEFAKGDEVKIQEGPFAGLIAKVRSASPSKRVKLLMRLLGGDVPLEMSAEDLQKVG